MKIGNSRNLFGEYNFGTIRILVADDGGDVDVYLNSSKEAKKLTSALNDTVKIVLDLKKQSVKEYSDSIELFRHNLVTVAAQLKDKVERIFNERVRLSRNFSVQVKAVQDEMGKDLTRAAQDFCQLSKRIDDLNAQVSAFRFISGLGSNSPTLIACDIRKIFLRCVQPFFDEFNEYGVRFVIDDSNPHVLIDPDAMGVALHHFFQNASKYVHPESDIVVYIQEEQGTIVVEVEMESIKIDDDEVSAICERGISGRNAIHKKGSGIGMFVLVKAIEFMGCQFKIRPGVATRNVDGTPFAKNTFLFVLPRA